MGRLFGGDTIYAFIRSRRQLVRTLAPTNTGAITGTLPAATGDIDGTATVNGSIAGSLPPLTAALAGTGAAAGTLAAQLPTLAGSAVAEAAGSGLLAAQLPVPTASLAGTAAGAGSVAGILPELAGVLTGASGTEGALAGALPAVEGVVEGSAATAGVIDDELPALEGVLNGFVETEESLLLGVLPAAEGQLTGEAEASSVLAGTLPFPTVTLVALVGSAGNIEGEMPALTGELTGLAQVPGSGGLFVILPAFISTTGWGSRMSELEFQRRATAAFIAANSITLALLPNPEQRTASGGVIMVEGVARPLQKVRLIPMSHTERPQDSTSGIAGAAGGQQRKYDMTLLAEWDAVVRENDFWYDELGTQYVVDALVPFNGYERKALVMAYGRRASLV